MFQEMSLSVTFSPIPYTGRSTGSDQNSLPSLEDPRAFPVYETLPSTPDVTKERSPSLGTFGSLVPLLTPPRGPIKGRLPGKTSPSKVGNPAVVMDTTELPRGTVVVVFYLPLRVVHPPPLRGQSPTSNSADTVRLDRVRKDQDYGTFLYEKGVLDHR